MILIGVRSLSSSFSLLDCKADGKPKPGTVGSCLCHWHFSLA